jgi:hypothetical protein
MENFAPTGVQTLDCPACSKFLYPLHNPGHHKETVHELFIDPEDGGSMHLQNDSNDLPDDSATQIPQGNHCKPPSWVYIMGFQLIVHLFLWHAKIGRVG